MVKFSVKKPLTVFVAVVAIIVLGIVAFTSMTPDLLPNLNLPYVLIITPYPGSTPEKTEFNVTRPLERRFATLENIKNIDSVSGENSSIIILEFTESVNMDTVSVDILQCIQRVSGSWESTVGTPNILKLNPSMLPVMVAAVNIEGLNTAELSALMKNEIIDKLEGIDGVASVSASGVLEEKIKVVIDPTLVELKNQEIREAIDKKFDETEAELMDKKRDLEENLESVEAGIEQLKDGISELAEKSAEGDAKIQQGQMQLLEGKLQLNQQLAVLQTQLRDLVVQQSALKQGWDSLGLLESALEAMKAYELLITNPYLFVPGDWDGLTPDGRRAAVEGAIAMMPVTDEQKAMMMELLTSLGLDDWSLDHAGYTALIAEKIGETEGQIALIEDTLAAGGITDQTSYDYVSSLLTDGISQLETAVKQLGDMLKKLEEGEIPLEEAMIELEKIKIITTFEMSGGYARLVAVESSLTMALAQIDNGLEQIKTARENVLSQSDLAGMLNMDIISQILTAQNFSMPAGYVYLDGEGMLVSVGEKITSVEELRNMVLLDMQMDSLSPVFLGDVAEVYMDDNREDIYAKIDGSDGVLLTFSKQSNTATAVASDNIRERFEQLAEDYQGLNFYPLMDQGDYIYIVVNAILNNLLLGAIFAIIILFLFLKDLRPTFITLCSIPISVVFAIVLMYFSGVTINIISLSGLAVAVGMLVDNSIVVIDNIFRLRGMGHSPAKAAIDGALQVAGAIASSTLTTVCVFVPIIFVEGITRQLFTDLALTMGYSLVASLVVALTLVPAMSSGLLKNYREKSTPLMDRSMRFYSKTLNIALKNKALVLAAGVVLLVASLLLVMLRGFSFMPNMEMSQLTVSIRLEDDASRVDVTDMTDKVLERIAAVYGIKTTGAMLSSGGMGSFMGMGSGGGSSTSSTIYVLLDEKSGRSASDIGSEIESLCADLDASIRSSSSSGMSVNMLTGSGVSADLYGEDLVLLQVAAKDIAVLMEEVDGVESVDDGAGETSPEIRFIVDKEKAMANGLTTAQVYMEISKALSLERVSTTLVYENNEYDIVVVKGDRDTLTPQYIKDYSFTVTDREGEKNTVWLRDLAVVEEGSSKTSISRHNQRRTLSVSGSIDEDHNISLVATDIQRILDAYQMPAGISLQYSGENESIMDAMWELGKLLALGILLVYLIMVAQFQSLLSPFIVMFTIPLAFTGGLLALLVTGMELSVVSLIGFVMLVGVIVNNGIVLVDYINQLRMSGTERLVAIAQAGVTRMRPILMTSLTTILGLSVMALGVGMGSELMQPIAITCIGGLLYATVLTLYVVPVMYDIFYKKEVKKPAESDPETDTN